MQDTSHPLASAGRSFLPIPGALSYYPAQHRGKFPSVRAALASIGCIGEAAALQIDNARVNASPSIAVPVTLSTAPGERCLAVVVPRPGGKADLWLGLLEVASDDRDAVAGAVRQFTEAGGGKGAWAIFEWTRQPGAAQ